MLRTSNTDGSGEPEGGSTGGALGGVPLFCRLAGGAAGGDKGWGGTALGTAGPGEGVPTSVAGGTEEEAACCATWKAANSAAICSRVLGTKAEDIRDDDGKKARMLPP